jgi:hypothetical protein
MQRFPILSGSAPPNTTQNLREQVANLIVGYGVEISFTISNNTWDRFYGYVRKAQSGGGHVSLFGNLYGAGGGGAGGSYQPWDNIVMTNSTRGVTLRAQNNKVPTLLGAILQKIA